MDKTCKAHGKEAFWTYVTKYEKWVQNEGYNMPAPKSEKTEYLKARVDEFIKKDFEAICESLRIKPAEQMRQLAIEFIKREEQRLGQRIQILVTRPNGYDYGAWRVEIRLRNPRDNSYPVVFPFPKLEKRIFHSDVDCQAAWRNPATEEFEIGGLLQNGIWRGHLYSNGIAEIENPTSLELIKEELRRIIDSLIEIPDQRLEAYS